MGKESRLLTDEEIEGLKEKYEGVLEVEWHPTVFYLLDAIAQAQDAKSVKAIIKWGLERCPHWAKGSTREVNVMKRDCSQCWETLERSIDE